MGIEAKYKNVFADRLIKQRLSIARALIVLLLLTIIFQGAVRKWLFPQLAWLFFFSSDAVVLPILFLTWRLRLFPIKSPLFISFAILSVVTLIWGIIQSIALNMNSLIIFFGWRNYFYYGYLAFAIGSLLNGKTILRLAQISIWLNIPMAFLSMAQYYSPADAFVNKLHIASVSAVTFDQEHTRCTLTFTDRGAPPFYIAWMVAILISALLIKRGKGPAPFPIIVASGMGLVAILMQNGSRMSFAYSVIVCFYAIMTMFAIMKKEYILRCVIGIVTLVVLFVVSSTYVFKDATESMVNRQETVGAVEGSLMNRVIRQSTSFMGERFNGITVLGAGLGLGSGGGGALYHGNTEHATKWLLAEDEWLRILQELGGMGFLYLLWRICAAANITIQAFAATKRSQNPLVLTLAGYAAVSLFNGYMTCGNSLIMWYCFGVCMALNNLGKKDRPVALLEERISH